MYTPHASLSLDDLPKVQAYLASQPAFFLQFKLLQLELVGFKPGKKVFADCIRRKCGKLLCPKPWRTTASSASHSLQPRTLYA